MRGGIPLFSEKRLEDIENKERERAKREARSQRDKARGLKVAGAKFETRQAGNLETRLAGTGRRSARVVRRFATVMRYFTD
jgi:hypothetical protein